MLYYLSIIYYPKIRDDINSIGNEIKMKFIICINLEHESPAKVKDQDSEYNIAIIIILENFRL